ncbi:MAG: ytrB 1 [Verrucomicrobiales bacterium]|nr:ytrB 1 [Verrucomicrobiales bacterium]
MTTYAIEAQNVCRSFGQTKAVQNLNLRVPRGSIYGFLGRNGAGKTTLIRMLAGLIRPDSGELRVHGVEPGNFTVEERSRIGYMSEKQILPLALRVDALIKFTARFYPAWDHAVCDRILKRFRIDRKKRVRDLSQGGMRQVAFMLALAQKPDLLILDEPAANLDVVARREFLDEVLEMIREEGRTVFLSSHILSDIERIADQVGILGDGTLKVSESLDELKETVKQVRFYNFPVSTDQFDVPGAFRVDKRKDGALVTLRVENEESLQKLAALHRCQYELRSLNLEDIFVEIAREF